MTLARGLALIALLAGLAGCASGPRIVASDVRTVAAQAPGATLLVDAHYRFEPTAQVMGQPAADRLQALAQAALARVGLVRDDAHARLSVQVAGTVRAYWVDDDWGVSNPRMALGLGYGWRGGGMGFGFGGPLWDPSIPLYVSEAHILMRDIQSGQIVYDSRARHDGPWHNTDAVLAALFVAALQGYPDPPPGPRRVDVPVTLQPAGAAPAPVTAPAPAPAER